MGKFVIKRTRVSLDRPAAYEVIPGKKNAVEAFLEFKESGILKKVEPEESENQNRLRHRS